MGRSSINLLKNQQGQFLVESVLLVILSLSLLLFATKQIREKKLIAHMIEEPWSRVTTMVESGVWASNTKNNISKHPNTAAARGVTLKEF